MTDLFKLETLMDKVNGKENGVIILEFGHHSLNKNVDGNRQMMEFSGFKLKILSTNMPKLVSVKLKTTGNTLQSSLVNNKVVLILTT